jgi:hypothetical protein
MNWWSAALNVLILIWLHSISPTSLAELDARLPAILDKTFKAE